MCNLWNHLEQHTDTAWTSTGTDRRPGLHTSFLFLPQTHLLSKRSLKNKQETAPDDQAPFESAPHVSRESGWSQPVGRVKSGQQTLDE